MGKIEDMFGNPWAPKPSKPERPPEQALIINFYSGLQDDDTLYGFGQELGEFVDKSGLGRYDGQEIAMDNSHGSLFLFAPKVEDLFKHIKPMLDEVTWLKGAEATLYFGPTWENPPEITIKIGQDM